MWMIGLLKGVSWEYNQKQGIHGAGSRHSFRSSELHCSTLSVEWCFEYPFCRYSSCSCDSNEKKQKLLSKKRNGRGAWVTVQPVVHFKWLHPEVSCDWTRTQHLHTGIRRGNRQYEWPNAPASAVYTDHTPHSRSYLFCLRSVINLRYSIFCLASWSSFSFLALYFLNSFKLYQW